jgi:hypothetical protein
MCLYRIAQECRAAPPGGKRVPSVGTYINRLPPGQAFSIWELHDHGSSSQPVAGLIGKYTSVPGSLKAILPEAGSNYLLPTAEAPSLEIPWTLPACTTPSSGQPSPGRPMRFCLSGRSARLEAVT